MVLDFKVNKPLGSFVDDHEDLIAGDIVPLPRVAGLHACLEPRVKLFGPSVFVYLAEGSARLDYSILEKMYFRH